MYGRECFFQENVKLKKKRDSNPPDSSDSSQLFSSFSVSSLLNGDVLNGLGIFSLAPQKPQTTVEKSVISVAVFSFPSLKELGIKSSTVLVMLFHLKKYPEIQRHFNLYLQVP